MEKKRKLRKFNQEKRSGVGYILVALTVLVIAALIYVNV